MKKYAQVIKVNGRVNLIGTKKDGLYLFDLPLAYSVDITDRPEVTVGMSHDRETDTFTADGGEFVIPEINSEPTQEEQLAATEAAILALMEVL